MIVVEKLKKKKVWTKFTVQNKKSRWVVRWFISERIIKMANTIQKTDFQSFTRLPLKEIIKGGSEGTAVVVQTPHRGEVIIEYKRISRPLLGADNSVDVEAKAIIRDLMNLEDESLTYLLNEWMTKEI